MDSVSTFDRDWYDAELCDKLAFQRFMCMAGGTSKNGSERNCGFSRHNLNREPMHIDYCL